MVIKIIIIIIIIILNWGCWYTRIWRSLDAWRGKVESRKAFLPLYLEGCSCNDYNNSLVSFCKSATEKLWWLKCSLFFSLGFEIFSDEYISVLTPNSFHLDLNIILWTTARIWWQVHPPRLWWGFGVLQRYDVHIIINTMQCCLFDRYLQECMCFKLVLLVPLATSYNILHWYIYPCW